LTSAPQAINQYRNLDFIFNNPFIFSDRYRGEAGELTKPGQYIQKGVKPGRVWETNFVANLMEFQPKEHSARGAGTRNSLFEFVGNTMSAHLSAFPPGKYIEGSSTWAGSAYRDSDRERLFAHVAGRNRTSTD
jgi:hypothetical protein